MVYGLAAAVGVGALLYVLYLYLPKCFKAELNRSQRLSATVGRRAGRSMMTILSMS